MSGIFDMVSGVLYMLRIPFARTLPSKDFRNYANLFLKMWLALYFPKI